MAHMEIVLSALELGRLQDGKLTKLAVLEEAVASEIHAAWPTFADSGSVACEVTECQVYRSCISTYLDSYLFTLYGTCKDSTSMKGMSAGVEKIEKKGNVGNVHGPIHIEKEL